MKLSTRLYKKIHNIEKLEDSIKEIQSNIELLKAVAEEGGAIGMSTHFFNLEVEIPAQVVVLHMENQLKQKEAQLSTLYAQFKDVL